MPGEPLAEVVRTRAGWACEYCRIPEGEYAGPFEVDHVIAARHGGPR
jgi:hypothetical protein